MREFTGILAQRREQDLAAWIAKTRLNALPGFDSCFNGLDNDHEARAQG